jgi:hypothetical protein
MNPAPEILNELRAISPLLASLERINVFWVPEGYFDGLQLRIADYVFLNETSGEEIKKKNLQQVPAGYFDTLSDAILAKVRASYPETAKEELRNLSPMLLSLKGNVFSVPEGYFESFAENVVKKLNPGVANFESANEEPGSLPSILHGLKGNVFSVPEGYFESFAGNLVQRLRFELAGNESPSDELRKLSPILMDLRDENVFTVPKGYFESFADGLVEKVKPQPAKVVSMKRRNLSWVRYAAAAVVTGAIAVGSLQIFSGSPDAANLPDNVKASFQYKTEADLNAGIAKLSDDDIIKFLEKNGNVMDEETLTNNTDVSEMPSQDDYLSDENTLNAYLDKIDAGTTDKSNP